MKNTANVASLSNNQVEKTSKWTKVGKIATGIALAGALTMGVAKYTKDAPKNADTNEATKVETVINHEPEVKENADTSYDESEYEEFVLEMNLEAQNQQITRDSIEIAERNKQVEERNKQVEERNKQVEERNKQVEERNKQVEEQYAKTSKKLENSIAQIDEKSLKSSKDLQNHLRQYFALCKEAGEEPSQHAKDLMASLNQ